MQLALVFIIAAAYTYLVVTGKAPIDGFVMLALLVIKHFLDMTKDDADNKMAAPSDQTKTQEAGK